MWTLKKKFRFEASHVLPFHGGKCARLHGHSWHGTVVCTSDTIQETGPSRGMVADFSEIGAVVDELVRTRLDHYHLNESIPLENPTCEEIARWIYSELRPRIPLLSAVIIEETCTSSCEYRAFPESTP